MTRYRRHNQPTTQVCRRFAALAAGLVSALLLVGPMAAVSAAPEPSTGLGGGTDFHPGSTFPFVAGQPGRVTAGMFVQNIGTSPARVALSSNAPTGITITSGIAMPQMIAPTRSVHVPFAIQTSTALAVGSYKIIVSLGQTNVPKATGGGSTYAPAVIGSFVVKVIGASGKVTVNAVSGDDKKPITGTLSLSYLDGPDATVALETITGSTLTRAVVPGKYRAQFEMPGLSRKSKDFSIAAGQTSVITLSVQGVQFLAAAAKPGMDAGRIVSADLIASVRSTIRRMPGPVKFNVTVVHDGKDVETVKIAELPELATGTTEQRTTYRPANGFSSGRWTFKFSVSTPAFIVNSTTTPGFTVKGANQAAGMPSGKTTLIVLAALAVPIGGWYLWFWLVGRRRRKREPERTSHARKHAKT